MKRILILVLLAAGAFQAPAQVSRTEAFHRTYTLKEVVVLSRHNIRAPLSGNGSVLERITPHEWIQWTAPASHLTRKGGMLETTMGQYFREWLDAEGLPADGRFAPGEVLVYANSMQRTLATARYFTAGFAPAEDIAVQHRFAPSRMDPVFHPRHAQRDIRHAVRIGKRRGVCDPGEREKPAVRILKALDLPADFPGKERTAPRLEITQSEIGRVRVRKDGADGCRHGFPSFRLQSVLVFTGNSLGRKRQNIRPGKYRKGESMDIQIGDVLEMKKKHPCGAGSFLILRTGADFRLKCTGCGHEVMAARSKIERHVKRILRGGIEVPK